MFENPGPYAQRQKQADTFEQHLQQVYFRDGFRIEDREGEQLACQAQRKAVTYSRVLPLLIPDFQISGHYKLQEVNYTFQSIYTLLN